MCLTSTLLLDEEFSFLSISSSLKKICTSFVWLPNSCWMLFLAVSAQLTPTCLTIGHKSQRCLMHRHLRLRLLRISGYQCNKFQTLVSLDSNLRACKLHSCQAWSYKFGPKLIGLKLLVHVVLCCSRQLRKRPFCLLKLVLATSAKKTSLMFQSTKFSFALQFMRSIVVDWKQPQTLTSSFFWTRS